MPPSAGTPTSPTRGNDSPTGLPAPDADPGNIAPSSRVNTASGPLPGGRRTHPATESGSQTRPSPRCPGHLPVGLAQVQRHQLVAAQVLLARPADAPPVTGGTKRPARETRSDQSRGPRERPGGVARIDQDRRVAAKARPQAHRPSSRSPIAGPSACGLREGSLIAGGP